MDGKFSALNLNSEALGTEYYLAARDWIESGFEEDERERCYELALRYKESLEQLLAHVREQDGSETKRGLIEQIKNDQFVLAITMVIFQESFVETYHNAEPGRTTDALTTLFRRFSFAD